MGIFSDLAEEWDDLQNPFYPLPPETLFQAAISAGGKLKWTVQHADGASRTITFVARKTHLISERSQGLFSVFIVEETKSGIKGSRLRSAGSAGQPGEIGQGVTNEFGAAVNGALIRMGLLKDGEFTNAGAPKPRSKAAPTKARNPFTGEESELEQASEADERDLASQLSALNELHESGALTAAEFKAAKKKLLS
jgi:hypothetical protein